MSLATRTVLGALWTVTASAGGRALGLIGTLLLATLLSPAEYGEANVASILALSVSTLSSLGLRQYVVATPGAGSDVVFHVTVYHVLVGWVALAALAMLGTRIAPFFDAPMLGALVPGMAFSAALDRVGYVPFTVLVRDMRFKVLGLQQLAGEMTYVGVALGLARAGFGPQAIVAGNILRSGVQLLILTGSVNWRSWLLPHRLRLATTRELLRFGIPQSAGTILHFVSSKWDNLLVAKMFGTALVGQYNFAYNLADIPASQVGEQIGDVLLPSFARLGDPEARRRGLARSIGLLALIVYPMAIGLGVTAFTLREAFLGSQWSMVGGMLAILSVLSVARPVGIIVGTYLQSRKRPVTLMLLGVVKVVALVTLLPLFGQLGPLWACAAIGVAFGIYALANLITLRRQEGMAVSLLVASLGRPLLACVFLACAAVSARWLGLMFHWPAAARLGLEVVAGVVGYAAGVYWFARPLAGDVTVLLKRALSRS
jgi:PST family polysaccharide transporter